MSAQADRSMTISTRFHAVRCLFGLALLSGAAAQANTVIYNVHGYTLDASGALREFDALSFTTGGEVIVAGTRGQAAKLTPGATFIDGEGAALLRRASFQPPSMVCISITTH